MKKILTKQLSTMQEVDITNGIKASNQIPEDIQIPQLRDEFFRVSEIRLNIDIYRGAVLTKIREMVTDNDAFDVECKKLKISTRTAYNLIGASKKFKQLSGAKQIEKINNMGAGKYYQLAKAKTANIKDLLTTQHRAFYDECVEATVVEFEEQYLPAIKDGTFDLSAKTQQTIKDFNDTSAKLKSENQRLKEQILTIEGQDDLTTWAVYNDCKISEQIKALLLQKSKLREQLTTGKYADEVSTLNETEQAHINSVLSANAQMIEALAHTENSNTSDFGITAGLSDEEAVLIANDNALPLAVIGIVRSQFKRRG